MDVLSGQIALLRITWYDATSVSRWVCLDEAATFKPVTAISIGYLVDETKKFYTLASSVIPESGLISEIIVIPKGMLHKVEVMTPKKGFIEVKHHVKSTTTRKKSKKAK